VTWLAATQVIAQMLDGVLFSIITLEESQVAPEEFVRPVARERLVGCIGVDHRLIGMPDVDHDDAVGRALGEPAKLIGVEAA